MWIGTRNGLNRYDGHSFKAFRPQKKNSISNEVINDIAEDSKGRIWVATMEGLNIYDPLSDHWEVMIPLHESDNDIPSMIIWDIYIDNTDKVWIASDVFEFSCYSISSQKFTFYDWPGFVKNTTNLIANGVYTSIKKIVPDNQTGFWLASNKGIVHLDTAAKTFRFAAGGYKSEILDLQYDRTEQKVYLSIEKGRMFVYNIKDNSYKEIIPQKEPYPSTRFRSSGPDERWLASDKGLLKLDPGQKKLFIANHIPQLSGSMLPGSITTVYIDNTGIRWLGTSNGISIHDPITQSPYFFPLLPVSDKSSVNNSGGVFYDTVSTSYFVCNNDPDLVFIINSKTGNVNRLDKDASGIAFNGCHTIKQDNDRNIWLLTESNIFRYNRQAEQFFVFPTPVEGDEIPLFRDMIQDAEGNYWFGSFNKGIFYYRTKEKRFASLKKEDSDYLQTITSLLPAYRKDGIWIGTFSFGIFYYDLKEKQLTRYYQTPEADHYSSLDLVQDLTYDNEGRVWVATHSGGVFRYNSNQSFEKTFTRFDMRSGLRHNSYLSASGSSDSIIWLLSGKGITAITTNGTPLTEKLNEQSFDFSSFASDARFPHKIYYDNEHNELLVGVGGGLLIIPTAKDTAMRTFPVVLTSVTINDTAINTSRLQGDSLISYPYHQNSISLQFASLYYGTAGGFFYEYKLNGYNKNWINAGNVTSLNFQNLPPGIYELNLRVKDAAGNITAIAKSFKFKITPPFWLTWWFITLAALFLAMIIYLLFRRRIALIKNKATIKQQMAELEAKALRAQMNPHFIFNSLNAIQECIVTEKTDAAFEYLSKFSRLLRLVLNSSEKNFISLSGELDMIRLYLSLESLRFRQSFNYYIEVDEMIDTDDIKVPTLLVQPFVENAVWHGLRMKEGEKKLWLRFMTTDQHLIIEIEDNGIGREKAAAIKKQKLGVEQFESKGTALSQQRIGLLNRQGTISAGVEIIDLLNSAQQPTGTKIIIQLPFDIQKPSQSKPFEYAKNTDR